MPHPIPEPLRTYLIEPYRTDRPVWQVEAEGIQINDGYLCFYREGRTSGFAAPGQWALVRETAQSTNDAQPEQGS